MKNFKAMIITAAFTSSFFCMGSTAFADEDLNWKQAVFPPPNGGLLVYAITNDGNPACASYDGRGCLWGQSISKIDFTRVRPLVCGAGHRELFGVTGYEDPNHWCNLTLKEAR